MSAGFSAHVDGGTNHPDADARCWWCLKPVLSAAHDFAACHEDMKPKPRPRKLASGGVVKGKPLLVREGDCTLRLF